MGLRRRANCNPPAAAARPASPNGPRANDSEYPSPTLLLRLDAGASELRACSAYQN